MTRALQAAISAVNNAIEAWMQSTADGLSTDHDADRDSDLADAVADYWRLLSGSNDELAAAAAMAGADSTDEADVEEWLLRRIGDLAPDLDDPPDDDGYDSEDGACARESTEDTQETTP